MSNELDLVQEKKQLMFVDASQYGLDENKALAMKAAFVPMLDKMIDIEKRVNVIKSRFEKDGISDELSQEARELRLECVKVRTGTAKIHKQEKDFYLSGGRFVDAWKNVQLSASQGLESTLSDIENYYENMEKEAIRVNKEERTVLLLRLDPNMVISDFIGEMDQEVWNNFYEGTKAGIENKKAAELKAEEDRIKQETISNLHHSRVFKCSKISNYIENFESLEFGTMEESHFNLLVESAITKRNEAEEIARINKEKADNAEKAQRAALKEQAEKDLKSKNRVKEQLRKEKEEKLKLEIEKAEIEAYQDNILFNQEQDRLKAEEEARLSALAPDKDKLIKFADDLNVYLCSYEISIENETYNNFLNESVARINEVLDSLRCVADK